MVILSKFAENLNMAMQEQNVNAPKLAEILSCDRSNVTRYLQGKRYPSFPIFMKMLEFFQISADVLLGRADYGEIALLPPQPFQNRLRLVMQETHTSQYRIEKDLKISGESVYSWLQGETLPTVESLDKLADYMDVSVDYLLGRIR